MEFAHEKRPLLVVPALVLGVCMIFTAVVVGRYVVAAKAGHSIDVTGSAQRIIASDVVKWRITLTRTAPKDTMGDGYKLLKSDLDTLQKYLRKSGVASGITIAPVGIEPVMSYGYMEKGSEGPVAYTFRQEVTVESQDIAKITRVAQDASSLISGGALISTTSLEYFYSKLPELKIAMLSAATEDAKNRAAGIAESAGASLGGLRSASMGVFQITAPNSTEVSDYGMIDTASVKKQITAVVRASFTIR